MDKCSYTRFTRNKNLIDYRYKLKNIELTQSQVVKDLGVLMDEKMTFQPHIEKLISECNRMLGFVCRSSKDFKNVRAVISLYYAYVYSKLSFASVIWNPLYKTYVDRIERIQNKFLRTLGFKIHQPVQNSNYEHLRNKFSILTLRHRRILSDLCLIYKIINVFDSPYLLSKINFNVPERQFRQVPFFKTPFRRTNLGANSPLVRAQKTYNDFCHINADIFTVNINRFKNTLRSQLLFE